MENLSKRTPRAKNKMTIALIPPAKKAKKTPKVKGKKVAKIEPKLPTAGVERLRSGTSSIPSESKTLGMTYGQLQGALKRELGATGYTALIKANRAAKSKVTKPKATQPKSRAKPAKAASKKRK